MNPQPFYSPPRSWKSRLSPFLVQRLRGRLNRDLEKQGIVRVDARGAEGVQEAIQQGMGVLVVSNHSFHYDSYVLIEAAMRGGWYAQFMTAWQVFALAGFVGRLLLQWHGCFSVNRERTDTQAFRTAVDILTAGRHPLVIFPEGDIYHSNDRAMPFREGAAAIALSAMKRDLRPIVVVPCAMKCFYTVDPRLELSRQMDRLEEQIRWRPRPDLPLLDRVYRFGSGFLSLKEVEYLGAPRLGTIRERLAFLTDTILTRLQHRHGITPSGESIGERIRAIRGRIIKAIDPLNESPSPDDAAQVAALMDELQDLFFVTQLTSYHGDYSSQNPTVERVAETIDKFEEDLFALQSPTPRGKREAVVRFGTPVPLNDRKLKTAVLTRQLETSVQELLNSINSERQTAFPLAPASV